MNWIPNVAAALPAPRDDEPPELRRRIIAEVRDHLECAYQRELVLTGDADEALRRVRSKFGDPAKLARKLWFDALKEKIVSQRILVGLCAVMTVTCLGLVTFVWKSTADAAAAGRTLLESHRESQQAFLDQSQKHNQKLLKQLESLEARRPTATDDRADFRIELVKEGSLEPAEGCQVTVSTPNREAVGALQLDEVSGPDGIIDCGRVRGERYHITVTSPFDFLMEKNFFVRSGRPDQVLRIVVPSKPAPQFKVSFEFEWPEELRDRLQELGLGVLCEFEHPPVTIGDDGQTWQRTNAYNQRGWDEMWGTWLVKPGGETIWIYDEGFSDPSVHRVNLSADSYARSSKPVLHWKGARHSLVVLGLGGEVTHSSESTPARNDSQQLAIGIFPTAPQSTRQLRRSPVPLQLREDELNRIHIQLPDDLHELIASQLTMTDN